MNNQKPFSIMVKDFKANIVEAINSSGLPLELVFYILEEMKTQVQSAALKTLERDEAEYYKAVNQDE